MSASSTPSRILTRFPHRRFHVYTRARGRRRAVSVDTTVGRARDVAVVAGDARGRRAAHRLRDRRLGVARAAQPRPAAAAVRVGAVPVCVRLCALLCRAWPSFLYR